MKKATNRTIKTLLLMFLTLGLFVVSAVILTTTPKAHTWNT